MHHEHSASSKVQHSKLELKGLKGRKQNDFKNKNKKSACTEGLAFGTDHDNIDERTCVLHEHSTSTKVQHSKFKL